jgi:hypothetical protein
MCRGPHAASGHAHYASKAQRDDTEQDGELVQAPSWDQAWQVITTSPPWPPRGQPREVLLSISSSDLTSVPQSRRRARASGGGDQTKKLPRNSESLPIDIAALQETRSTASHRSSAEPTGEMTGVTLSGSTVASNQVFESSGGRALIPNAKGRRETQVSLDGSADPLVKDRQSDTKIDIVTTPVPTVVEPPRQSRQRNIMARYVFGEELRPGERWKRRLITR